MEFRVLGPLTVIQSGRDITPTGSKPRSLLGMLLLHANQSVSIDRIIDALWNDDPPTTARHAVEVYVCDLRRSLGGDAHPRLLTRRHGYELRVEEGELDAARFELLCDAARRARAGGDLASALRLFRAAETLWHAPPLGDLADAPFARPAVARLDALRAVATQDRLDALLAAGRHAEAIVELAALVALHPLNERLRGQLMLALYRDGRQAEALEAYRDLRSTLKEDLGLDPGDEIEHLQVAILRHDPALAAPAPVALVP